MIKKLTALAVLATSSVAALASPMSLAVWDNSTQIQNQGLVGVQFVSSVMGSSGQWVALGAHPYKSGVSMPNDGTATYFGMPGLSMMAPAGQNRANWSFDFAFSFGDCVGCSASLVITDNNNLANIVSMGISSTDIQAGNAWLESWNLEMAHLAGFAFDPFADSSTRFSLVISDASGAQVSTAINVDVMNDNTVPEPGSLALAGLALAGLALVRRRKA